MASSGDAGALGDLQSRLHELHFGSNRLDHFLEQVTVLGADLVDGDTSGGVTVIRNGQAATVASSDERTKSLDEIQYANGEGPCLHAARTGDPVTMLDVDSDTRWPAYRLRAKQRGLRSSLSIPLSMGPDATGALNLYVFELHDFGDEERAALSQFCDEASRAISLALRHDQVTQENDHLHNAMASRRVIDQAIGIIMAQNRCSADDAFHILRRASMNRNAKVQQLAVDMIRGMTGTDPSTDIGWNR
jgi:GAF domain-containing protein